MKKTILYTSLAAALLLASCSSEEESETVQIEEESSIVDDTEEDVEDNIDSDPIEEESDASTDHLTVGESARIDDITLTIDDAYLTDERNETNLIDVSGVLILEVTYENNTEETFPTGRDIVVESEGELMRSYKLEDLLLEDLPPGESISGRMAYGLVNEPETLTATFQPLLNESEEEAVFEIDISDEQ
ncbi:hypothetical protein LNK15_04425 [Jeotgalicoccus huakuii]|nr:hypothetical protein [Jeotgalicoccus huakuii]